MICNALKDKLIQQIGHEMTASQQYLAIAGYFESQSLSGFGEFFYAQSEEERGHGMKIFKFLLDAGITPSLPQVSESSLNFSSAESAVAKALEWERSVTQQFRDMADIALQNKDYVGFQFLQWFLEEQVEEESLMTQVLDLIKSGINLFQAQALLPKHE